MTRTNRTARTLVPAAALLLASALPSASPAQSTITTTRPTRPTYGDADNGMQAATILQMEISPRAVALGGAMGAVEGDPTSIFYAAAGIARIKTNSFFVTGSQRFAGNQLAAAAVTFPTAIGTFGIGARAFNAGVIDVTENYELLGRARAYQVALEGGGAIQLTRNWLWGGTMYYAQETLSSDSRGSIGINSSMIFPDILFKRLSLGLGFRNYGTNVRFETEAFEPPLVGFFGASFDVFRRRNLMATPLLFRGQPIVIDAKLVGQLDVPDKHEVITRQGIEATVNGVLIGRIGYRWGDDNKRGLSVGSGINVGQFRLEYAFRNRYNVGAKFFSDDPLGDEHHVSATYFWGGIRENEPRVPVIVTAAVDTAAINAAIRDAIERQMAQLRPLLDSLRSQRVEVESTEGDMVARYVVPVHFGFDSAVVRDSDYVVLGQIADVIRRIYPNALVTIEGFADPAGSVDYNLRLSRRRADAVKRVMVERFNMPESQFKTIGYGEQTGRQVAPGQRRGDPGAESNRRVTFTIDATQHFR